MFYLNHLMEFGETREHEMRHRHEIESLTAETLALRTILTNFLHQVGKLDPHLQHAVRQAFDESAASVLRSGQSIKWDDFHAVRVVEQMRAATLGDKGPSLAPLDTE